MIDTMVSVHSASDGTYFNPIFHYEMNGLGIVVDSCADDNMYQTARITLRVGALESQ
jgi:hypothetical protein